LTNRKFKGIEASVINLKGYILMANFLMVPLTEVIQITCPDNAVVDASSPTDPESLGSTMATNFCGADVNISFTDQTMVYDHGGSNITRTWTANDDCGNTSSCNQTIIVLPLDNISVYQYSYEEPS
jgi:hypothetical protein